jgi:hypothetical protein
MRLDRQADAIAAIRYCGRGAADSNLFASFQRGRSMLLRDRMFGFASSAVLAVAMLVAAMLATAPVFAGDDAIERPIRAAAPLELPHATERDLAHKARKRDRRPGNIERHDFLALTPGLEPLTWPKNSDLRARIVTPQLKSTPIVGWIAENLYRSKKDNGWCLEVDPGEGEYVVFYRRNLK